MATTTQEVSPIVAIKLGGCPPPQRSQAWKPLIEEILEMPDDGTWLCVEMRDPVDVRRAQQSLQRWHTLNADHLDCNLEMRAAKPKSLWIRKTFKRAGPHPGGRPRKAESE